ncbi:MAG: hypothetical protein UY48_C0005G0033 [Candidatus Gottesmanbacteria bacterium GW2011_GWB1_49_7]|uniref:Uncharacterized protein n=1 Tax=Candidatus Gottesmanbacteria bacterium GW2011_GWB1_49_7 TaxID=1618448 RepID=A0A0G1YDN1_9BACT|nr:MAG: hypothetical protein UY48_C0005G0033 [Candidatus Gottesmanbacteria bacterium GW2011_GWB1_49_7]
MCENDKERLELVALHWCKRHNVQIYFQQGEKEDKIKVVFRYDGLDSRACATTLADAALAAIQDMAANFDSVTARAVEKLDQKIEIHAEAMRKAGLCKIAVTEADAALQKAKESLAAILAFRDEIR